MSDKLPEEIWVHAGCYEGLVGKPVYDQRWFAEPINTGDVKYVRAQPDGPILDTDRVLATAADAYAVKRNVRYNDKCRSVFDELKEVANGAIPYRLRGSSEKVDEQYARLKALELQRETQKDE